MHRLGGLQSCGKTARAMLRSNNIINPRLNDGGFPAVNEFDFCRLRIHAHDPVPELRETPRSDTSDVTESKNADIHTFWYNA